MSEVTSQRRRDIGQRIEARRRARRIPGDILARSIGVSPKTLSRWEKGETSVPFDVIQDIADELSCSARELLGIEAAS